MRALLVVLVVLALVSLTACGDDDAPAPQDAGRRDGAVDGGAPRDAGTVAPLSIATWNLEQFPKTSGTIHRVSEILRENRFELVGVQEITDPRDFEDLRDALPGWDARYADEGDGFLRVGFLWRTERLEVTDVRTLFQGDGYAFPRPAVGAHVAVLDGAGGTVFDFQLVVLHLKASIDDPSRIRRTAAIRRLDDHVRDAVERGADPDWIVIGDFNDELTDDPPWNVFTPLLDAPDRWAFLTREPAEHGDHTLLPFESMIDHVLITTDALGEYGAGTTRVLHLEDEVSGYRRDVSDHVPVVATFELL